MCRVKEKLINNEKKNLNIMDNYHLLEFIGEGSFAKVHRGRKKYTGQVNNQFVFFIKQSFFE